MKNPANQSDVKEIKKIVENKMAEDNIIRFDSEEQKSEYEREKRRIIGASAYNQEKKFESQAERNLIGIELEEAGRIDEAILIYEQNVKGNFEGSHPYTRLAIIYRKRKQIDDEIRILKKAARKFRDSSKGEYFSGRLEKAEALKAKIDKRQISEKNSQSNG